MSLEKIVSVPGMSGLYKMIAQLRNGGFVVESLADKKRLPIDAAHRVVKLEDISVYTIEGEMPLREVFLKMKDHDADVSKLSSKSEGADLRTALKKVVPNFDEERVHTSDIKKMIAWYALLKNIIDFTAPVEIKKEDAPAKEEGTPVEATTKPAKAKGAKPKKAVEAKEGEEKPVAKKRAAKKSTT